jgi:hypothetical protein
MVFPSTKKRNNKVSQSITEISLHLEQYLVRDHVSPMYVGAPSDALSTDEASNEYVLGGNNQDKGGQRNEVSMPLQRNSLECCSSIFRVVHTLMRVRKIMRSAAFDDVCTIQGP